MRTIHVFYIFSLHTSISISNVTLSFIESWAHPIVVVVVEVVVVQVAVVHVPHVVRVVSRTKPNQKLNTCQANLGLTEYYPILKLVKVLIPLFI